MAHNLTSHPSTPAPNPTAFTPRDRGGGRKDMTRQCPEGQRFDPITKTCVPIAERRPKDEGRVFRDVETGQVSGVTTIGGKTFLGTDRKDVEKVLTQEAGEILPRTAALEEEREVERTELERGREFEEQFGIAGEIGELKGKVLERPDLDPGGVFDFLGFRTTEERSAEKEAFRGFMGRLFTGQATKEELLSEGKKAASAGLFLGGLVAAAPFIALKGMRLAVGASMKLKSNKLVGTIAALATVAAGGGLVQWRGTEMSTMRTIIGGYVEDGEKLIAIDRASGDHEFIFNLLQQASNEIDQAEAMLQELANANILNKVSKRWMDDMNNIRTARFAVLRRMTELQKIAETGSAVMAVEDLVYETDNFDKEE